MYCSANIFVYKMKDRIAQIIEYKSLTPSRFADIIGIQRSRISHIMSGRNNASIDVVTRIIEKFPEIDLKWLMTGEGQMSSSENGLFGSEENILRSEDIVSYQTSSSKPEPAPQQKSLFTPPSKKIERIIAFYTDGSFKEFRPE